MNQPCHWPKIAPLELMGQLKLHWDAVFLNSIPKSNIQVSKAEKHENLHKNQNNDPSTELTLPIKHK